MKKSKLLSVFLLLILTFTACSQDIAFKKAETCDKKLTKITLNNTEIIAEIANTSPERAQGLMFRKHLHNNRGMLFIYESEEIYNFWMKNTLIPLDMIWIDKNFQIVHIEHAIPCKQEPCKHYIPDSPAMYVLELPENFTLNQNIKINDRIEISGPNSI